MPLPFLSHGLIFYFLNKRAISKNSFSLQTSMFPWIRTNLSFFSSVVIEEAHYLELFSQSPHGSNSAHLFRHFSDFHLSIYENLVFTQFTLTKMSHTNIYSLNLPWYTVDISSAFGRVVYFLVLGSVTHVFITFQIPLSQLLLIFF